MKILAIGDLHGRMPKIHFKDFDAIILVGDLASDKEIGKHIKSWFKYLKNNQSISLSKYLTKKLGKKNLKEIDKRSLAEGRKILEKLDKLGKPMFMVPGNWDDSFGKTNVKDPDKNDYLYLKQFLDYWLGDKINPKLTKGLKNLKDCQFKNHEFNGINIVGYGLSSAPEKPSARKKLKVTKDQKRKLNKGYKKIIKKLKTAYDKRNKKIPTIFISHNVPYNTKLDIVLDKKSYAYRKHLGSTVARNFCEKYQPLICIGGHIHEHHKKDKIKKTTVINAGFGSNANTLIEIKNGKLKSVKFYKN